MTPQEEEAVRRALTSTPPVGPVPDDVRDRLAGTLAALVAEQATATAAGSPVADLPVRRARRWPRVLLAAAAAAVVVAGVGTVLDDVGSDLGSAGGESTAGGTTSLDGGAQRNGAAEEGAPSDAVSPFRVGGEGGTPAYRTRLRSDRLDADVQRVLRTPASGTPADVLRGCRDPGVPGSRLVAVRLDGVPAVLAVRTRPDGVRSASVHGCRRDEVLARTALPPG